MRQYPTLTVDRFTRTVLEYWSAAFMRYDDDDEVLAVCLLLHKGTPSRYSQQWRDGVELCR